MLAERDRLSREIHDTLAQGLASIVLFSRAAQDSLAQDRPDAAAEQLRVLESTASADLAEARRFVRAWPRRAWPPGSNRPCAIWSTACRGMPSPQAPT